jgi:hypothetical protein
MTISLYPEGGEEYNIDLTDWRMILDFARTKGWVPQGTLPLPQDADPVWDGSYTRSDGQIISSSDATSLAKVLWAVLAEIPKDWHDLRPHPSADGNEVLQRVLTHYLSGPSRGLIEELAAVCEGGSVEIW